MPNHLIVRDGWMADGERRHQRTTMPSRRYVQYSICSARREARLPQLTGCLSATQSSCCGGQIKHKAKPQKNKITLTLGLYIQHPSYDGPRLSPPPAINPRRHRLLPPPPPRLIYAAGTHKNQEKLPTHKRAKAVGFLTQIETYSTCSTGTR